MLEELRSFLGWCTLVNIGLLLWWSGWFLLAHDWLYRLHGRFFEMPVRVFDAIHYAAMGMYKLGILLFFMVPYLVLRFLDIGGTNG